MLDLRRARKSLQCGDFAEADRLLAAVEAGADGGAEPRVMAELHSHRAAVHVAGGQFDAALEQLARSRQVREQLSDREGLALVDKLTGNAHLRRHDHARARAAFESAVALTADQADSKTRLESEISLALCDAADGAAEAGERRLRAALAACERSGYEAGLPRAWLNLAVVLGRLGRHDESVAAANEAARRAGANDPAISRAAQILLSGAASVPPTAPTAGQRSGTQRRE
jgi:tetratricopeptide (TPR) repeat protein